MARALPVDHRRVAGRRPAPAARRAGGRGRGRARVRSADDALEDPVRLGRAARRVARLSALLAPRARRAIRRRPPARADAALPRDRDARSAHGELGRGGGRPNRRDDHAAGVRGGEAPMPPRPAHRAPRGGRELQGARTSPAAPLCPCCCGADACRPRGAGGRAAAPARAVPRAAARVGPGGAPAPLAGLARRRAQRRHVDGASRLIRPSRRCATSAARTPS